MEGVNMVKRICYGLTIISCVAVAGCAMLRTSGVVIEKGRLYLEDPAFAANIEVVRDVREKTPEGFLHAQVTVKNANRDDYACQYRFEWRGQNGMIQKHAQTTWRPAVLHGRETMEFDGVSPLQGTEDFRLAIRRAD